MLTLSVGAAGCGGGAGSVAPTATPLVTAPTSSTSRDDFVRYAACMKRHGVDAEVLPGARGGIRIGGPGAGNGPTDAAIHEADQSCRSLLRAEQTQPTNTQDAKFRDRVYAFVRCLRGHGFDVPDPKIKRVAGGYDLTLGPPPGETAATSANAHWVAAQAACHAFNPFDGG